jgi:hypothetical protein
MVMPLFLPQLTVEDLVRSANASAIVASAGHNIQVAKSRLPENTSVRNAVQCDTAPHDQIFGIGLSFQSSAQ